ncbi:CGNR zinc finger domain-containing protein [Actinomadura fibrosa]|uniref:CGNR zinc finger domain-containing protein n=1 Tax=Actinomadura fibrosa TaxID=111802 RepID=A0ABW2XE93_9ACTN|nr:CGNR zinc finger domain-containing protein [Actinomadura fibrosa]
MNFNSHTDAVVQAAAGLVNTLTPGERRGRPYTPPEPAALAADVTEVLRGVSRRAAVGPADVAELAPVARELRAVFEAVAAGDVDAAAGQVNRMLDETQARPRLERHDGEPWHVHFHGAGGTLAADWAGPCATGLAVVIGGDLHDRLGVCTAPHCDRVYVDTSRNGARRFCSTACQNRVKTAAFRARTQTG